MKLPARAALPLLLGAGLLAGGCGRSEPPEYTEADGAVPEGVTLEPTDEPAATGGVSLPGNVNPAGPAGEVPTEALDTATTGASTAGRANTPPTPP